MILTHGANSIARGGGSGVVIGGREYRVVTIGTQMWLAENLDYKFDGLTVGSESTSYSDPMANYYNNDEATYGVDGTYKCGLLYNWPAVKYLNDNKSTLLPDGWHVPTNDEWNTLATAVGGLDTAGAKLKALDNSVTSDWPSGWNGSDDYGFNALPAGLFGGSFSLLGERSDFWTATEKNSYSALSPFVNILDHMQSGWDYKKSGHSVRLVKDS